MFINYEDEAKKALAELKRKNLFRNYPVISVLAGDSPYAIDEKTKKKIILWGNNNYLGLAQDKEIISAKISAIKNHGVGASGTRNILGTSAPLDNLEKQLAKWFGKDKALVHISALDANIGVLCALGKKFNNAVFLSDEYNHASMIDGIKLSGATKYIFKHNDISDLEKKLKEVRLISDSRPIIIAIESIYSMTGDVAPLKEIVKLKEKYNCLLYLDEVHAIGVRGKTGAGIAEEQNLSDKIDIICGTMAKAMGVSGGFVVANEAMIEMLRHNSKNFIFTTALSPDIASACLKSLEIILSKQGKELRLKHQQAVDNVKKELRKKNIKFLENNTHIIPILIGDEARTSYIAKHLLEDYNIAVTPIFAPTVPISQARLRINPTPHHTKEMCKELAAAIAYLLEKTQNLKSIANDVNCYSLGEVINN